MNSDTRDDGVLIKEAISGNRMSFAVLINRYKNKIFNLCYRMTGNYQDAEDISQEAFLRAWSGLNKFRIAQKFQNWLFTIAINLCRNKLKRDKIIKFISIDKKIYTEDDEILFEIADKNPTIEEMLLREEEKKRINYLVHSLPDRYRPTFLLRYVEGLSYKEISEIMGLPIGTVEVQLFRAKKIILKKIKNSEIFSSA